MKNRRGRDGRKLVSPPVLLLFSLLTFCTHAELTERDLALMITAADFADFGLSLPERPADYESGSRFIFFDGTARFDYEFEMPDETEIESDILYLTSELSLENSARGARSQDMFDSRLMKTLMESQGVRLVEKPGLFEVGDESKLYELQTEENAVAVGNYFFTRVGTRAFMVMFIGTYIDDADIWAALVNDKLERIRRTKTGFLKIEYPTGE